MRIVPSSIDGLTYLFLEYRLILQGFKTFLAKLAPLVDDLLAWHILNGCGRTQSVNSSPGTMALILSLDP